MKRARGSGSLMKAVYSLVKLIVLNSVINALIDTIVGLAEKKRIVHAENEILNTHNLKTSAD